MILLIIILYLIFHAVFPKSNNQCNNNNNYCNKDQGKLLNKEFSSSSSAVSSSASSASKNNNNSKTCNTKPGEMIGQTPWDMDFNGQWEMDRDLIGEFIQKERKDENLVTKEDLYNLSHDEAIIIKCLPTELIDDPPVPLSYLVEQPADDNLEDIFKKTVNYQISQWESDLDEAIAMTDDIYQQPVNIKEAQTINLFKSKFDDNVKALWDNEPQHGQPSNDLLSQEMNSLSLFNWQQNNDKYYYLNVINLDQVPAHSRSTSNNSTGEKYIKSGTNLQTSIWSDNGIEGKVDSAESFSNKEVSKNLLFCFFLIFPENFLKFFLKYSQH